MIITDLQYRMIDNLQETGTGVTEYNTTTRIYKITADGASGYHASIILPPMSYMAIMYVEFAAKVTGAVGKAEIQSHSSPYYGAVFAVGDRAVVDGEEWQNFKMRYVYTSRSNAVYPRVDFSIDGVGSIELRNYFIRIENHGDIGYNEIDRRLRQSSFGPEFDSHQDSSTITTGAGTVAIDPINGNYTEFTATGTDTAYMILDGFEGFQTQSNTEYSIVEIDALVDAGQSKEAVARFAFRDAVGGDIFVTMKLTGTTDSGGLASNQTYKFFVVRNQFPVVVDSVELEIGAMDGHQTNHRIRGVRIRSFGINAGNLVDTGLSSVAAVSVTASVPTFVDTYRRNNFTNVVLQAANTIQLDLPYRTGKVAIPALSSLDSNIIPVPFEVTESAIKVQFYDVAGVKIAVSVLPAGYTFFVKCDS